MASTSPRTSPRTTSAPGLIAATSDEGTLKASSREDKGALELSPVDRASQATT